MSRIHRRGRPDPDWGRPEAISLLSKPGCLLCREEQVAVDRFFFWYLHEHYAEPRALTRIERSRGFCREHTRILLERALSSTIAYVYSHLLGSALDRLRQMETGLSSKPDPRLGHFAAGLMPEERCPACASRIEHQEYLVHLLRSTARHPEVRQTLRDTSGICLPHFLEVEASLDRETTRFLAALVRDRLGGGGGNQELDARGAISGRSGNTGATNTQRASESREGAAAGGLAAAPAVGSGYPDLMWSPALETIRELLAVPGCPVCKAQQRALSGYIAWLSEEIRRSPVYAWQDALWLCRQHGTDFKLYGDQEAVSRLACAIKGHWAAQLGEFLSRLQEAPPELVTARALWVRTALQRRTVREAGEQLRLVPKAREVLRILRDASQPPQKVLNAVRQRFLRQGACPACRYLDTVADRTGELLARGLGDPDTRRMFEASSGICLRHLPRVFRAAGRPEIAGLVLHVQRVRLEVLQWELTEFDRKRNWALRYEPLGFEASAWSRAVEHYSGPPWGTRD